MSEHEQLIVRIWQRGQVLEIPALRAGQRVEFTPLELVRLAPFVRCVIELEPAEQSSRAA